MLMEAVLESLKDLDVRRPQVEEPSSNGGIDFEPKPASKNGQEDSFSTQSNSPKTEIASNSVANEHTLASQMLLPDQNKVFKSSPSPKLEPLGSCLPSYPSDADINNHSKTPLIVVKNLTSNDSAPHHMEEETSKVSSHNATPSGNQSSSEVDMADRTKVTVKVEKNPTNNIMDGLLRRWDLNFFRNR